MKKSKISFYFLVIAFFTFITVFSVISYKSYSNLMGPIKEVQKSTLLNPIDPSLDISIIQQVESRPEYSSGVLPLNSNIINISSNSDQASSSSPSTDKVIDSSPSAEF